jgi:hypothetical protein
LALLRQRLGNWNKIKEMARKWNQLVMCRRLVFHRITKT